MHVCTYTHPYIHLYFTACGPPKHQRVMSGKRNALCLGMRICKAKSKLIDGSALLWTIHWPADGSVADFSVNVKTRITKYLTNSNVYNHQTPVRGIYKRIYKRDVIHQTTCFISACYGKKNTTDMSNTRLFVWGGTGRVTLTN